MTHEEYERRKQQLEEQLRAGIALLEAAHRQQSRALELVWRMSAEEDFPLPATGTEEPAALPDDPPPPVPGSLPVVPSRPRRRGAWELQDDAESALASVPEVFDRNHLCQALGYEPDRGSLYRTLQALVDEGRLAIQRHGSGKTPTQYRKIPAGASPPVA